MQRLRVGAEPFVQPEIVVVRVGELVGEPLVRELVVQQPVPPEHRLRIVAAVADQRLVLESRKRHADHAHLLVRPRIRADHVLPEIERLRELGEQLGRLLLFAGEVVEAHRNRVAEAALVVAFQHLVRTDVEHRAIGVDAARVPVPRRPAILLDLADQRAVARRHQSRRHGVVKVGGRRLQRRMIEARVQQVAAAAPQRRVDPRILAVGRFRPRRAAFPRRTLRQRRRPGIDDLRLELRAGRERRRERDAELAFGIRIRRWRDPCRRWRSRQSCTSG